MASFHEILPDSPGTSIAWGDFFAGDVRSFIVPASSPIAALSRNGEETDDSGVFFPSVGDPHPQVPYLYASSFRVRGRADSGSDLSWLVDVGYSLNGAQFNFPPPDKGDPQYRSVGTRSQTFELTVPMVSRITTNIIPGPPPAAPIDSVRYERTDQTIRVVGTVYTKETTTQVYGADQVYLIESQTDTLHEFGGRVWRYLGGRASQDFRTGVWTITHEWATEPGSIGIFPQFRDGLGAWNEPNLAEIPDRDPHQIWVVRPSSSPTPGEPDGFPEIVAVDQFPSNPLGWQNLPGIGAGAAP